MLESQAIKEETWRCINSGVNSAGQKQSDSCQIKYTQTPCTDQQSINKSAPVRSDYTAMFADVGDIVKQTVLTGNTSRI